MHQIGDFVYLRKLSDKLRPRDSQAVPAKVDPTEWQFVIPYDATINEIDVVCTQEITAPIAGVSFVNRTWGGAAENKVLPAGFDYALKQIELQIFFGAPVLNDETLDIVVSKTFIKPGLTTGDFPMLEHEQEDGTPYRLVGGRDTYNLNLYTPHAGYELINRPVPPLWSGPPIHLPILSATNYERLNIRIDYTDTAQASKNFPAASTITVRTVWERKPLDSWDFIVI